MENIFSDILLPITIAIITLGMGMSIRASDFRRIFIHPKALLVGISSQMFLLPLIAFAIAWISGLDPVFKVGLVIIASCPGGATSNLVTYLLKGNVALSISMTVLNSVITLVTIPLIVSFGLYFFMKQDASISLPVLDTILKVFLVTVLPATAGVTFRHYFPETADALDRPLRFVLPLMLLAIYLGVIFIDEGAPGSVVGSMVRLLPAPLMLNIIAMFTGWRIARLFSLERRTQFTISIEVGLQNSALAIFVAAYLLENHTMALMAVIYGSFSFFTTAFFGYLVKRFSR